jgi:hypothetical protein
MSRIARSSLAMLVVTVFAGSWSSAAEPTDPTKNYMGINVAFLNDYNGENAFVDIVKQGRNWGKYDASGDAAVDSENWPTQDCGAIFFGADNQLGVYKLVFEGQAASVGGFLNADPPSVSNLRYDAATNTSTADVTVSTTAMNGLKFQGTRRTAASATNTGIRNVRVYRPGYPTDGSAVFTNEWKRIVGKFHAIRFMNWIFTNTNPVVSWGQRINPCKATSKRVTINGNTGDLGAAMEHFIQACNETNCDLWMNMPCMVDDEYVTKTAQLILYGSDGRNPYTSTQAHPVYPPLNQNLKVYVEYGNEIWNTGGGFNCWYWIEHITDSIIAVTNGTHPIVYDGRRERFSSISRYAAWRATTMSTIFRGVFGDAAMMSRVRPVLSGRPGGGFNSTELPFIEGFYGTYRPSTDPYPNTNPKPVSYYFYSSGGPDYYGVYNWSTAPDAFFAGGNYPDSIYANWVTTDAIWSGNYGLRHTGYEGGLDLTIGPTMTEAQMVTLNADRRMKDLTVAYHDVWSSCGGDLIMYFDDVDNSQSYWAFTHSVSSPNSPKLQAIDKLRDTLSRAAVSIGPVVPCTLSMQNANRSVSMMNGSSFTTVNGEKALIGFSVPGYWIAVPVTAAQAGWYKLVVRCGSSSGTSTVSLWINGTNVGTRTAPQTMGNTTYSTVHLQRGLNVIRYEVVKGPSYVASVMLTPSDTMVAVASRRAATDLRFVAITVRAASGAAVAHVSRSLSAADHFAVFDVAGKRIVDGTVDADGKNIVLPRLATGEYFLRLGNKQSAAGRLSQDAAAVILQ